MRIITKFKDYYDSARCFTFCEGSEAVYMRKTEEQEISLQNKDLYWHQDYTAIKKIQLPNLKFVILGFCGKIYTIYTFKINLYELKFYPYNWIADHNLHFYDKNTVLKELFSNKEFRIQEKKFIKVAKKYPKQLTISKESLIKNLKELDSVVANFTPELEKWFLRYKVPVFSLYLDRNTCGEPWKLILNPKLENYEFYKRFVPAIAYQEIEMFFNSVLVIRENPIQITDNLVILQAKGFDKRISFRHRK